MYVMLCYVCMYVGIIMLCYVQCGAKSLVPTGNFPTSYEPKWNLKFLTSHFPTRDKVNWNMLNFF